MTHPTDTSEELREAIAKDICRVAEQHGGPPWEYLVSQKSEMLVLYREQADAAMSRARSTTGLMEVDVRGIALVAMDEQRKSGESDEMCARWISERVHKAAAQSPTPREKP